MARASTRTILPLDTFAKIIGISPVHFNQVVLNELNADQSESLAPVTACDDAICQYSWQAHDRMGREDVAQAIADAEGLITRYLGYPPGPTWITNEYVNFPRPNNPMSWQLSQYDVRGIVAGVQVDNGFVQAAGVEAWTAVGLNAVVVYSDQDGDGYDETATITVATTLTDPTEIAIYYPGTVAVQDYTWEIRPTTVRITGGNAIITCRREQLLKSALMETFTPRAADGEDNANFLTVVDVYRHYTDASSAASLLWDSTGSCCCLQASCNICQITSQGGCFSVRDPRLGIIALNAGSWNGNGYDSFAVCRAPDRAVVNYKAGISDARQLATYQRLTAYLALTLMERPICACDTVRGYMSHWSDDLAMSGSESPSGGGMSMRLTQSMLDNPLGTTRAAMHAWRQIKRDMLGQAARV